MGAGTERRRLLTAVGGKERLKEATFPPLRAWQAPSEVKRTARRRRQEPGRSQKYYVKIPFRLVRRFRLATLRRNGDDPLGKKWRRRKATTILFGHDVAANISTIENPT